MRYFSAAIVLLGMVILFLAVLAIVALAITLIVYHIYKKTCCRRINDFFICTPKNEIIQSLLPQGEMQKSRGEIAMTRLFLIKLKSTLGALEKGVEYSTSTPHIQQFKNYQKDGIINMRVIGSRKGLFLETISCKKLRGFFKMLFSKRRKELIRTFYHIKFTRIE